MPQLPQRMHYTKNIDQHVAFIRQVMEKSLRDGETRQLAVKIVSGAYTWRRDPRTGQERPFIQAYGSYFRVDPDSAVCPPRGEECELTRLWDFVVLNFRYVYDPADIDTFVTAKQSLLAGGGDCDDATILIGALAKAVGFHVVARVISTNDAPNVWAHIYPLVSATKDNPKVWIPMDVTVDKFLPGDEYDDIAKHRDYQF